MALSPLQDAASSPYAWNPQVGIPWGDPVFYINAFGLVCGILLLTKLRDRRGESSLADGTWWAAILFVCGTGLHFVLDLFNFPEQGDHVLIHITVGISLLVFFIFARRGD